MLQILLIGLGIVLAFAVVQFFHFGTIMVLADSQTNQGAYFAQSRDDRRRFRKKLRVHRKLLTPFLWVLAKSNAFQMKEASFQYKGIAGPKGSCDAASFERGASYAPRPEDVFVVTQMKCGTTWMQNLVYEIVTRGGDHLTERTLYSLSPWLESRKTIPVEKGPLVGRERPTRLIKTHFPISLCPFTTQAKYIYVVRHPVSCFASCADFLASNLGPLTPDIAEIEHWYCSPDIMWWSPWPDHVAGWWKRSIDSDNVLFLRFRDMKEDLAEVARRVAAFLDVPPLTDTELAEAVEHCRFAWMSENYDLFEMQVPHLLQDAEEFFKSGRVDRFRDVPADTSERILQWCRERLASHDLSLNVWYPDQTDD